MSNIQVVRSVRESPFRETEWDRRLDDMLEDLENSAAKQQSSSQASSTVRATTTAASSSSSQRSQSAHSRLQQTQQQRNGYGTVLAKSPSGNSINENTDSMLREMDSALKASSNYIESHRTSTSVGPNSRSTQEYHEYRSYATNGDHQNGDFNLEKQVQHMMPPPSPSLSGLIQRSNNARYFIFFKKIRETAC